MASREYTKQQRILAGLQESGNRIFLEMSGFASRCCSQGPKERMATWAMAVQPPDENLTDFRRKFNIWLYRWPFDMPDTLKKKRYSIAEAKDRLTRIIHEAEDGVTIELTRRAKPVAVLISLQEYQRFHLQKDQFWKRLQAFRKKLRPEDYLRPGDLEALRERTTGRKIEF